MYVFISDLEKSVTVYPNIYKTAEYDTILKEMEKSGVEELILTPHYIENSKYNCNNDDKVELFNKFQERVEEEGINVTLYLGNEVYITDKFIDLIKDSSFNFVIELGRYIASSCGCYITKIMDIKNDADKNYCIIDGGINHINYYGQIMGMKVPCIDHTDENFNIKNSNNDNSLKIIYLD